MAQPPLFNVFNMSNMHMLQNRQQVNPQYIKAMKDAANSVQLQKQSKKTLQQITADLQITSKLKKEEIVIRIQEEILKLVQNDFAMKSLDQILDYYQIFRTHEILAKLLRQFKENKDNIDRLTQQSQPQRNPQPNYSMMFLNPFQQAFQGLASQLNPQQMSMLPPYYPQMRQFMPNQMNWMPEPPPAPVETTHLMCPCKATPSKRVESSQDVKCINCEQKFHSSCLKIQQQEFKNFECPSCTLGKMDPINLIVKVLHKPFMMTQQQTQLNFIISVDDTQLFADKNHQLEIRSVRLEYKYMYETTWPDVGDVLLNGQKITEYKPLKSNSSLKKRKDEPIIITQAASAACLLKSGHNSIVVKEQHIMLDQKSQYKLSDDAVYAYAIYLTKKRSTAEMINSIKSNKDLIRSAKDSTELIQKYCQAQHEMDPDIRIDKISIRVQLKCQYDSMMIKTPARGRFCNHVQFFSLENAITMIANCNPRKWKCPICKNRIFEIYIDSYQLGILEGFRAHNKNVKEVIFDQEGAILEEIIETIESSDEDNQQQKEKKVVEQKSHKETFPLNTQQTIQSAQNMLMFMMQNQSSSDQKTEYLRQISQGNSLASLQKLQLDYQLLVQHQLQQQLQSAQQQKLQPNKERLENLSGFVQNKLALKALIEQKPIDIHKKQAELSTQLLNGPLMKARHSKFLKYSEWYEGYEDKQTIVNNEEKQQQKSNKMKEKLVRVVKKQYQDFIRKNFGTMDNPKLQAQQQQLGKPVSHRKTIYKLSEIEEQSQKSGNKVHLQQQQCQPPQFEKLLADQIIKSNPSNSERPQLIQQQKETETQVKEQPQQVIARKQSAAAIDGKFIDNPICIDE